MCLCRQVRHERDCTSSRQACLAVAHAVCAQAAACAFLACKEPQSANPGVQCAEKLSVLRCKQASPEPHLLASCRRRQVALLLAGACHAAGRRARGVAAHCADAGPDPGEQPSRPCVARALRTHARLPTKTQVVGAHPTPCCCPRPRPCPQSLQARGLRADFLSSTRTEADRRRLLADLQQRRPSTQAGAGRGRARVAAPPLNFCCCAWLAPAGGGGGHPPCCLPFSLPQLRRPCCTRHCSACTARALPLPLPPPPAAAVRHAGAAGHRRLPELPARRLRCWLPAALRCGRSPVQCGHGAACRGRR